MRSVVSVVALAFLLSACSGLPKSLQPYREDPTALVHQIDQHVYSPVTAGLKSLQADLLIDVTGFFPPERRPAEPVWVPGGFVWSEGKSAFRLALPPKAAQLEAQLLRTLEGKEEDIVNRPFSERLAGDTLSVQKTDDDRLAVTARTPSGNTWRLRVDENFLVPQVEVDAGTMKILSALAYDDARPARIQEIATEYLGAQTTRVLVKIAYETVEGFAIPSELSYTGAVGQVQFPPFTIRLRNVRVNEPVRL